MQWGLSGSVNCCTIEEREKYETDSKNKNLSRLRTELEESWLNTYQRRALGGKKYSGRRQE